MIGNFKPLFAAGLNRAHPLAQGLVGCWLFNEGGGNKAYDYSGQEHHGVLTSMNDPPIATSGWCAGPHGGAVAFDGSNDRVVIPNSPYYDLPADSSLVVLFKVNTVAPSYQDIIATWQNGWTLYLFPNDLTFWTGTADIMNGGVIAVDTWYHVVLTRTGTAWVMYLNGAQKTTGTGSTSTSTNALQIGNRPSGGSGPLNGTVSHVSIYNRALSAQEVAMLYAFPY